MKNVSQIITQLIIMPLGMTTTAERLQKVDEKSGQKSNGFSAVKYGINMRLSTRPRGIVSDNATTLLQSEQLQKIKK